MKPGRAVINYPLSTINCLPGAVNHHGLTLNRHQPLLFQVFQYPADHFPGAADDAADFLAGDLDLHAIRVGHGVGLFAQVQQGAGHAASHIQEGQIPYLAGSGAQAAGDLGGDGEQDVGVFPGQLLEFAVADFGDFTFGLGFYLGRT